MPSRKHSEFKHYSQRLMKTLLEISTPILANSPHSMSERDCWKVIAKEYAKQALIQAAEVAEIECISYDNYNVDKQSILNVIEELR